MSTLQSDLPVLPDRPWVEGRIGETIQDLGPRLDGVCDHLAIAVYNCRPTTCPGDESGICSDLRHVVEHAVDSMASLLAGEYCGSNAGEEAISGLTALQIVALQAHTLDLHTFMETDQGGHLTLFDVYQGRRQGRGQSNSFGAVLTRVPLPHEDYQPHYTELLNFMVSASSGIPILDLYVARRVAAEIERGLLMEHVPLARPRGKNIIVTARR